MKKVKKPRNGQEEDPRRYGIYADKFKGTGNNNISGEGIYKSHIV